MRRPCTALLRRVPLGAAVAAALLAVAPGTARAWDAIGHRAITWLALDALDPALPAWMKEAARAHMIGWQAAEADRWRGVRSSYLTHENAPDHFIDIEDLDEFGLTLETINPLRYRYVRDMAVARWAHREGDAPSPRRRDVPPYNERLDPTGQKEWPGFLPHAIVEHHAKLISAFKTFRTLERLNEPARAPQLEMARANIAVCIGHLSHFVGDAAQPLHTTRHFNGWVGDNPHGYTTRRTFHAYIDGGVLKHHGLNYHTLREEIARAGLPTIRVDPNDPWRDVLAHIRRSHERVVPLYELDKSGRLDQAEGRAFIVERLLDASAMLAALINSAWAASEITDRDVQDFIRYDSFAPGELPHADPADRPAARPRRATRDNAPTRPPAPTPAPPSDPPSDDPRS
jgi:hypothetical protein